MGTRGKHSLSLLFRSASDLIEQSLAQVSTLCRLHHPNVVRFYGATFKPPYFFIVTELCPLQLGLFIAAQAGTTEEFDTKYIDDLFSTVFRYE